MTLRGLTYPYWALLRLTWPDWALLSLTGPYRALLGLTGPYWASLGLTGPYWALLCFTEPYWALLALTLHLSNWLTNACTNKYTLRLIGLLSQPKTLAAKRSRSISHYHIKMMQSMVYLILLFTLDFDKMTCHKPRKFDNILNKYVE